MQRSNSNFHRRGGDGRYSGGNEEHPTPSHSQQPVEYRPPQFNSQHPAPYAQYPPQAYRYNPYFQNPNYMLQESNLLLHQIASLMQYLFSIAHVILSNTDNAKITIYQNHVKLCLQGKLELNIAVPKQYPPSLPSVAPQ